LVSLFMYSLSLSLVFFLTSPRIHFLLGHSMHCLLISMQNKVPHSRLLSHWGATSFLMRMCGQRLGSFNQFKSQALISCEHL
jgi:hypothetical protein